MTLAQINIPLIGAWLHALAVAVAVIAGLVIAAKHHPNESRPRLMNAAIFTALSNGGGHSLIPLHASPLVANLGCPIRAGPNP